MVLIVKNEKAREIINLLNESGETATLIGEVTNCSKQDEQFQTVNKLEFA
jgi:phosphoribosylaminoimidazole (AIR) synthetase